MTEQIKSAGIFHNFSLGSLVRSQCSLVRCQPRGLLITLICWCLANSQHVAADMLADCRALSLEAQDIHNCLDNFLDQLDDNMVELEEFINGELGGEDGNGTPAAQAFERSQAAFRDYRRENCLWYLEFSTPREEGEQIARNCLAEMSQQRINELQRLIAGDDVDAQARGYYVYGSDRNTLQICGQQARLWVEGQTAVVGELQQAYLSAASSDKALMYVVLTGEHAKAEGSPYPDHDGVFTLTSVIEIRAPGEGDCQLPTSRKPEPAPAPSTAEPESEDASEPEETLSEESEQLEPEQQLNAYFGAWLAECTQLGDSYGCKLSTELALQADGENQPARLELTRRSRKRTIIDLILPVPAIEDTEWLSWRIDESELGEVLPSRLEHEENNSRQLLRERSHIQNEILPLLTGGVNFVVEVKLGSGEVRAYQGTLMGLTRALSFADDFTLSDGKI